MAVGESSLCVLCGEEQETATHLFLYCEIAQLIWMEIFYWLKVHFGLPQSLFSLLNCLLCVGDPKARKGRLMICCAVIWTIWKFRNAVLFDNGAGTITELVEGVKLNSWKWWLARSSSAPCLFYEWKTEPTICLNY
jgi:hypothetical protein